MIKNPKTKTPSLRFPEFSEEWSEKRLGEIFEKISSGKDRHGSEGEYILYGSTGVIGKTKNPTYSGEYILVARVGANAGMLNTVNGIFGVSDNTLILIAEGQPIIPFYSLILKCKDLNKLVFGSGQPLVTAGQLKKIKIRIPDVVEQQKIASFLTTVVDWIENLKQQKQSLEQYKKGMMQKIFSREIRFRDAEGKEYPEWEEKNLGQLSDVRDGTHDSPKYHTTGFPLVTSKNLKSDGKINFAGIGLISEIDYKQINKRSKVESGDILFGMIGTIGNPVVVSKAEFAIKNVALIKEEKELRNDYLYQYLRSSYIKRKFHLNNAGGTQKFLALGIIRDLQIPKPSLQEQQRISDFLSTIDDLINLTNQRITLAEKWKQGLMQRMFV